MKSLLTLLTLIFFSTLAFAHPDSEADVTVKGTRVAAETLRVLALQGAAKFLAVSHHHEFHRQASSSDGFVQQSRAHGSSATTHQACVLPDDTEVVAEAGAVIEAVRDQLPAWVDRIRIVRPDGSAAAKAVITLDNVYTSYDMSAKSLSTGVSAVITLAITLATQGTGTAFGLSGTAATVSMAASSAALGSLCSAAALQLVQCDGNLVKAASGLLSTGVLEGVVKASATAGVTAGIAEAIGAPTSAADATKRVNAEAAKAAEMAGTAAPTMAQTFEAGVKAHGAFQAASAAAHVATDMVFGGTFDASLQNVATTFSASLMGALGANQIGLAYGQGDVDAFTHKVLHAGLGAGTGYVLGKEEGAVAGALGAFVAETFAEMSKPSHPLSAVQDRERALGRRLTASEFRCVYGEALRAYEAGGHFSGNGAKLAAATSAFLTGQDVGIAAHAGATAVDNNYKFLLSTIIMGGSIAYEAYRLQSIYADEGAVATLTALGIDVAAFYVGAKAIQTATPALRAAIVAALEKTPGLKLALSGLTDRLVLAVEQFAETKLGKIATAAEQKLTQMGSSVLERLSTRSVVERDFFKEARYTDKVLKQLEHGDYHAFPESVSAFHGEGSVSKIIGGDGLERSVLKIPGEYRGKKGVFEFIKEQDGAINHRLFRPDV